MSRIRALLHQGWHINLLLWRNSWGWLERCGLWLINAVSHGWRIGNVTLTWSFPNCLTSLHNPCDPCVILRPRHLLLPTLPPACSAGGRDSQLPMRLLPKCSPCLLCLRKPHLSFKVHSKRQLFCGAFSDLPQTKYCLSTVDPWTTQGLGPLTHRAVKNPCITFGSPKTLLIAYCWLQALLIE